MDQQLYELPDGWEWKKLGELCDKVTDGSHNPPKGVEEGLPMLSSRNIFETGIIWDNFRLIPEELFKVEDSRTRIKEGDVLLTIVGTIGRSLVVRNIPQRFTLQRSVAVLSSKKLVPEYFSYQLRSPIIQEFLQRNAKGAAQKGIYLKSLKDIDLVCPPLSEQKRIVEKLDALISRIDQAVNHLQESLGLAEALFASSLDGAFNPLGSRKNLEGIYELPDGWEWKTIKEVFSITSGKNLTKKDMNEEGKYPVFGGNGIAGYFNDYNLKGVNIIIGRVGALCGNVRLIIDPIWITDNAFYIKEYFIDINKYYLAEFLKVINLGETANKAAQPVISYKSIKSLAIPIPPLSIQKRIVENINGWTSKNLELKEKLQDQIDDLNALKASLLDAAFRGEL